MKSFYKSHIKTLCPKSPRSFISAVLLLNSLILPVCAANANNATPASNFSLSITGLYLQPNANNLQYAVFTTPLPAPSPNWYQKSVNPDYDGSFDLGLQYDIAGGPNQIALDWLHFDSKNTAASAVTEPHTSVGPSYYFGPAEQFLLNTSANSSVKFNVNQINLVFGHDFTIANNFKIKPIIGIGSGILKENIANNYNGADPVYGPYAHTMYVNSKFAGAGPRLGLDGQFFVLKHFGIDASMAGTVLLGKLATSTNFTSWTGYTGGTLPHNNSPADTTLSNLNQTKIVPEVESKVGVFYMLTRQSGSTVSLHAGYMFSDYVNAISQVTPSTLVPGAWEAGTVAIISQAQNTSDLSLNGPYLKLAWQFA